MIRWLLILWMIGLTSCGGEETRQDDSLLSTDLVNNPMSATGLDTAALSELPTMDFKDTMRDLGTLKEGEVASYDFEFTNNGRKPLIVSKATGSCGCTVAAYPLEPLPPGKTAAIKVNFNSEGKAGHQEKTVTVMSNAVKGVQNLHIKAEVSPKE